MVLPSVLVPPWATCEAAAFFASFLRGQHGSAAGVASIHGADGAMRSASCLPYSGSAARILAVDVHGQEDQQHGHQHQAANDQGKVLEEFEVGLGNRVDTATPWRRNDRSRGAGQGERRASIATDAGVPEARGLDAGGNSYHASGRGGSVAVGRHPPRRRLPAPFAEKSFCKRARSSVG